MKSLKIGERKVSYVRFANDIAVLEEDQEGLQISKKMLEEERKKYGANINPKKPR